MEHPPMTSNAASVMRCSVSFRSSLAYSDRAMSAKAETRSGRSAAATGRSSTVAPVMSALTAEPFLDLMREALLRDATPLTAVRCHASGPARSGDHQLGVYDRLPSITQRSA